MSHGPELNETLRWRQKGLGSQIVVLKEKMVVGMLTKTAFSTSAHGELRGHLIRFERKRRWSNSWQFFDIDADQPRGSITRQMLGRDGSIEFDGRTYAIKRKGRSLLYLAEDGEAILKIEKDEATANSGTLYYDWADPVLILTGLFVF